MRRTSERIVGLPKLHMTTERCTRLRKVANDSGKLNRDAESYAGLQKDTVGRTA